ncbi:hypothetical protein BC939DRAFT_415089, partial [Gamsiella multidivaricata]|uniref:uncharacterized protein n=1 Tax=Gamsiella multidivaricata TaxID=101098 RepID=UPI0022200FD3
MGLFSNKKKEDPASTNNQQSSNMGVKQQRPPPSPNGLHGFNNSSSSMQGGVPNSGSNNHNGHSTSPSFGPGGPVGNGPLSPMSPIPQQTYSPMYSPPSPTQLHSPTFASSGSNPAAVPATPQLFWTQRRILGTNPFPRFQHTSSITVNGTDIYLYGGSQRGTTKGDLFLIDSVSLECQAVAAAGADPPMAKSGHSAVNIGQYIIYFGGWDSMTGQCDDSLHVLHTGRKEWNKPPIKGPLPTPRHSHIGCSVGTTMYIFGGQVDNFYLDDIAAFDMKSITHNPRWEKLEPQTESPPARSGHCAGVHEGKIYVFGGADADYFYNDIWCFDPWALTWTPIPASGYLPTGRHGHACTVADGIMYIFGGNSPDGTELNDAYAFKIHERRWYLFQNVGPVASPRSGHSMCTIKDRVFVLGGESEQTKLEDSALIYYLEIPKIRFPDSGPTMIPPRQASSQKLVSNRPSEVSVQEQPGSSEYESDRNSGQQRAPDRPERPDRPDRRLTQRPTSPAAFGPMDRQGSSSSLTISQQTSQLINPQLGQRPLTTFGAPPPRGASAGIQTSGPMNDYQADGLSIATRRQTLRDDFQGGYGGAVIGTASPINSASVNRRTMHQMPTSPSMGVASPSPLRVINVSSTSPPLSSRSLSSTGDGSPTASRPQDRRTMNFVPPSGSISNTEDINPYAMEAITAFAPPPPAAQSAQAGAGSYVPPPPPGGVAPAGGSSIPANAPLLSPSVLRGNLPPPPTTPSPPVSGSIPLPPGADKKSNQAQPLPPPLHSIGSSTPIPGPLDRSSSPASGRFAARGSSGSNNSGFGLGIGPAPSSAILSTDSTARTSAQGTAKIKSIESRAEAVQDENKLLKQEIKAKHEELEKMKKRENWLMAEVILARDSLAPNRKETKDSVSFQNRRLSMLDLEKELERGELEGQQLKITKALIKVKEELKTVKMSIATQAQAASSKIKEAERVRTGALQEAAYLKAKLSSMSNAQQDPNALARVEMERAADLEKRLTSALNELEALDTQYTKAQEHLEQEKMSRIAADERSQGSALLADQSQAAHTRALAELASLHNRATKAEAEVRDTVSRVSELEHELGSLKKLHALSQESASKSATELAEAMIEISRLEQFSMQARAETISLQRMLSQERESAAEVKNGLSRTEQELEAKIKELEDHEVQLGLLKDVMREK